MIYSTRLLLHWYFWVRYEAIFLILRIRPLASVVRAQIGALFTVPCVRHRWRRPLHGHILRDTVRLTDIWKVWLHWMSSLRGFKRVSDYFAPSTALEGFRHQLMYNYLASSSRGVMYLSRILSRNHNYVAEYVSLGGTFTWPPGP